MAAADSACRSRFYEPGLRVHIRNALRQGATPAEIMEVLELTACLASTLLGVHTVSVGLPILLMS